MQTYRIYALVAVAALMGGSALLPEQDPGQLAERIDQVDRCTIPVGGVILWWGLHDEVPENFEVCDGKVPTTGGATLKNKKPNLIGRFPLGAPEQYRFRPWDLNQGGGEELEFATQPAHTTEAASHVHGMSDHTHSFGDHTHSLNSHTHTPGNHTHSLQDATHTLAHTHALGAGASSITVVATVAGPGVTFTNATINFLDPTLKGKSTDSGGPSLTSTGAPTSAKDITGVPSPADTGPSRGASTAAPNPQNTLASEVKGPGHIHQIEIPDIHAPFAEYPAFTTFLFIIRVK